MTDMIERVAKAIQAALLNSPARSHPTDGQFIADWNYKEAIEESYPMIARAAIEAIGKPIAEAVCVLCADGRPLNDDGYHVSKPEAGGILLPDGPCQAVPILNMIDAARK